MTINLRAERGKLAEEVAHRHVVALGMRVIARNLRVGYLELDIVARDGDTIVVVEVRGRGKGAWLGPLGSVGRVKRRRLRRAAAILWSRRWSRWAGIARVRFDVASVDVDARPPEVTYIRAAFV
ncbi:MAG: YraN family protein [Polyangiaceae bacterium]